MLAGSFKRADGETNPAEAVRGLHPACSSKKFHAAAGRANISHHRCGTNVTNAGANIHATVIAYQEAPIRFDERAAQTNATYPSGRCRESFFSAK